MDDVRTVINAWLGAERDGDAEASERLLTEDFVGIGPLGFQLTKSAWLHRITGGGLHYERLDLDETTVRTFPGCAILTGRWNAEGTAGGHPVPEAARLTLVAVATDDSWQVASIHYSFVAGTAGAPALPRP